MAKRLLLWGDLAIVVLVWWFDRIAHNALWEQMGTDSIIAMKQ